MDVEAGAVDGVLVVLAPVTGHVPAVIRNLNSGHDRLGWSVLYCTVLYCTVLYCTVLYCTVLYR